MIWGATIYSRKGAIDVLEVPDIDIHGEGTSTERLIEITEQYVSRAKIPYQNIWVIFDKDDFKDFDSAIRMGEEKGYSIAWSNQCFEYWLYLHFNYGDADLHRRQWKEKLDELFKENGLSKDGYEKNLEDLYELLDSFGGVEAAVKNAKRRMAEFDSETIRPSEYAPGTMVGIVGFLFTGLVDDSTVSVMPMFYTMLGLGVVINILQGQKVAEK